jgi:hypothetical protein
LPARGLPRRCSCCVRPLPGRGPEEGVSPKCSGKDHRWSQAKKPVVGASCDKTTTKLT